MTVALHLFISEKKNPKLLVGKENVGDIFGKLLRIIIVVWIASHTNESYGLYST